MTRLTGAAAWLTLLAGTGTRPAAEQASEQAPEQAPDHVPEQKTRRAIYQHVRAYPGLHLSEIARHVGLPTNHAKYHLRRLEKTGLVSSLKDDGYWRFFPRTNGSIGTHDVIDRQDKRILGLLRRPKPLGIVLHLLRVEEATHGQIAEVLDVAGSTAHYHLRRLETEDLVARREEGRCVHYRLTRPSHIADLVKEYEPPDELVSGFLDAWGELELQGGRRSTPPSSTSPPGVEFK